MKQDLDDLKKEKQKVEFKLGQAGTKSDYRFTDIEQIFSFTLIVFRVMKTVSGISPEKKLRFEKKSQEICVFLPLSYPINPPTICVVGFWHDISII